MRNAFIYLHTNMTFKPIFITRSSCKTTMQQSFLNIKNLDPSTYAISHHYIISLGEVIERLKSEDLKHAWCNTRIFS